MRRRFVRGMFKRPQPQAWLHALTLATLRSPLKASIALLSQGTPRKVWRDALVAPGRPTRYAVTPRLAEQGRRVAPRQPAIQTMLFEDAGHALFADVAPVANRLLGDCLQGFAPPVRLCLRRPDARAHRPCASPPWRAALQ